MYVYLHAHQSQQLPRGTVWKKGSQTGQRVFEVNSLWQSDLTRLNGLELIANHIRMQECVYRENPHTQTYQIGLTAKLSITSPNTEEPLLIYYSLIYIHNYDGC